MLLLLIRNYIDKFQNFKSSKSDCNFTQYFRSSCIYSSNHTKYVYKLFQNNFVYNFRSFLKALC